MNGKHGGSGLALSIVRKSAEIMGDAIACEPIARFAMTLSLSLAYAP
jgi:signal transduction histidine kinase